MLNVALPFVRTEQPETFVAVRHTVPVGVGSPEGTLIVTVTVIACAVVMLDGVGTTFTIGVILAGVVTTTLPYTVVLL